MAGAFVQDWSDSSGAAETSASIAVGITTPGNLLVATIYVRSGGTTINTPAGWNLIQVDGWTWPSYQGTYWRIATNDANDDFNISWVAAGTYSATVCEYSGLSSTTPLDDFTQQTVASSNSQGTGTATPLTAAGLSIAILGANNSNQIATDTSGSGLTISKSYSIDVFETWLIGSHSCVSLASLPYSAQADQSTTWWFAGSSSAVTGMLVFREPGAAGVTFDGPDIVAQTGTENTLFSFDENGEGTVASRFTGAVSYAYAAGSDQPAGLTVNPTTGNLEGTPTSPGSYNVTIEGSD